MNKDEINKNIESRIANLKDGEVIAFIDGSSKLIDKSRSIYAYGLILKTNKEQNTFSEVFDDSLTIYRNVAGEIRAAVQAIAWAIKNNKRKLILFFDYIGIQKWITKEWDAKNALTKSYVKEVTRILNLIDIEFIHVKSHSGIKYHNQADKLAKKALQKHILEHAR
ncbi:RNase H family protein [Mycoplasmopsis pullorum]|uniref:RNase H family protein n=2 Tax=Mycoplasmopsis pullorum TaxID=48003 RepID=UPI001118D2C2|nr:RNase H family protein [Mycoplasmopsis pullorum]TNK83574.1 RNase H [Mycoplasmopsis pullorum]